LHNTLIIIPPDPRGQEYTREMRCQEKREVLGTLKPPLTPALLCALFRDNRIPFLALEHSSAARAADRMRGNRFSPGLILMPTCTPTIIRDMEFARGLKEKTGAATAAFGPHTSGIPAQTLEEFSGLDYALIGEPEQACLALARGEAPARVHGLAYRNPGGGVAVNPPRAPGDALDAMPFPDWSRFDLSRYRVPLFGERFLLVELSRGCPYHCEFCVAPLTHAGPVREKTADRVIAEIKHIKQKYGVSFFYFWGDTAVFNPRTMRALAERIIADRLDIQWISNTRPEAIADLEYARLLRRSGCRVLSMGAESGDPATLERMGKKLDYSKLTNAVRTLRDADIQSFVFFMFGYPGETMKSLRRTRDLALKLDPDYANFYPVVPYPGTPLWTQCVEQGLVSEKDWSRVDFTSYVLNQPALPARKVMHFVRRARLEFYLRPDYMLRTIKNIGSPARALQILKAIPGYFDL
jgi:radical SAM superfamily enzyme YgiQ (UPF0313 family)